MPRNATETITHTEARTWFEKGKGKPRQDHEHLEQVRLFNKIKSNEDRYPEMKFIAAVPNGGHRGKAAAGKMKAEGVRRGVLDIQWDLRRGEYSGLRIEMKTETGKMSKEQREWARFYEEQGFLVCLCRSAESAWNAIVSYWELS